MATEHDEATFWGRLQKAMDDRGYAERGRPRRLSHTLATTYGLEASDDTVRAWKTIKGVPSDTSLVFALAEILRVDADYLFGRDQFERRGEVIGLPGSGRLLDGEKSEAAKRVRRIADDGAGDDASGARA